VLLVGEVERIRLQLGSLGVPAVRISLFWLRAFISAIAVSAPVGGQVTLIAVMGVEGLQALDDHGLLHQAVGVFGGVPLVDAAETSLARVYGGERLREVEEVAVNGLF